MSSTRTFRRETKREALSLHLPFPPSVNNIFNDVPGRGHIKSRFYREWAISAAAHEEFVRHIYVTGPVDIDIAAEEKPGHHEIDTLSRAVLTLLRDEGVIEGLGSEIVRKLTLRWGIKPGVSVEIIPI